MNPSKYIWFNNKFINWQDANIHVLSHALHYGSGVFEGIRAYKTNQGPAIFKAEDHYKRLLASCETYKISCQFSAKDLINATIELINKNQLPDCYIRPIVFTDYSSMGIIPKNGVFSTAIAAWTWGSYLGDDGIKYGIRCQISHFLKTPSASMPSTAKSCANYANSFLAKNHAISKGYDEAILLNQAGYISEGPGENIFMIKNNRIVTPPITDDVLNGITRQSVMHLAKDLGYTILEDHILPDDLFTADECFFTGTAAEVTPIREINDQPIGLGKKGPITAHIQDEYFKIVKGENPDYFNWLTFCERT